MSNIFFLPTDYQAPKSSNFYMKFQEGENKFRILSQPIVGWEDWMDKKPVRYRMDQKPKQPYDAKKPIKHFWAMVVWNYADEEIQVLHLTQATIRKSLESLCADSDWGMPYFYDIKVIKTGEGMDTDYVLTPLPHKELAPHIKNRFNERRCNLEALFNNDDPFSKDHTYFTQGIFSREQAAPSVHKISMEQAYDLECILSECDKQYVDWIYAYIKKHYNADKICDVPAEYFDRMKLSAQKNMHETHEKQKNAPINDLFMESV